jgi:hypothetical protein
MRTLLAIFVPLLAAATLPNCSLVVDFTRPGVKYTTSAAFRNAAGQTFTVTDADAEFAGGMSALRTFGAEVPDASGTCPHSGFCGDDYVRQTWSWYVSRRLAEGSDPADPGFAAFQARYGAGPYCLVADTLTVALQGDAVADLSAFLEAARPLPPTCASGVDTGCGNAPGVTPHLVLTPAAGVDFGLLPVGRPAGRQPVVISNDGPGRLCLAMPRLSPGSANPGDFSADASDCGPRPGEEMMLGQTILAASTRPSCTVWADFQPTDPGARAAEVAISSNDPTTPNVMLPLRGSGEAGVLAVPSQLCLNVPPEVIGGMTCYRRTLDLRNDGPGTVTVRSMSLGVGADNWHLDLPAGVTTPFTIADGGTVTVTIRECGTAPMDSTFLTVNSNAAVPSVMVPMVGPTTGCTP